MTTEDTSSNSIIERLPKNGLLPYRLHFFLAHVPARSAYVLRRFDSKPQRHPFIGHRWFARTNLVRIYHDRRYRRETRRTLPVAAGRTLACWPSMVPVCSYWPAGSDGSCYYHPPWGFGIVRRFRPANHP